MVNQAKLVKFFDDEDSGHSFEQFHSPVRVSGYSQTVLQHLELLRQHLKTLLLIGHDHM
jgi:hypothetical protein